MPDPLEQLLGFPKPEQPQADSIRAPVCLILEVTKTWDRLIEFRTSQTAGP